MATSESSLQTQLKDVTALLDNLEASQTVPADVATVVASNAGPRSDRRLIGANSFRGVVSTAVAMGQALLASVLQDYQDEIVGRPAADVGAALSWLYDDWVSRGVSIESRGFTFGSPSTFGSSKGELVRLTVEENGYDLETGYPETRKLRCVSDQNSGAARFSEVFLLTGQNRGKDILEIKGSGQALRLVVQNAARHSMLSNSTFSSYSWTTAPATSTPSTGVSGDEVTDWTLGDPTNAQLDVDLYPHALPDVTTPTSVRFTTNNSISQLISTGNNRVNPNAPHRTGIWIYREASCDGTLTIACGSKSQAFTISGYSNSTWTWIELDADKDLWPANWLTDQAAVTFTLASRTTGSLVLANPYLGPMTPFDGSWYALPAGTATHALKDEISWTDSISSDSKIQRQIVHAFGTMLPHRATTSAITAGGATPQQFYNATSRITAGGIDFEAQGFAVGMTLVVTGTSSNNGSYTIASFPTASTIEVNESLTDEGPLTSSSTLQAFPTITDPS